MAIKRVFEIKESVDSLKKLKRSTQAFHLLKRIEMLVCLKTERYATRELLANHLSISTRSLERWIGKYMTKGLSGLLSYQSNTRRSNLITPQIHAALKERLESSTQPFIGYWDAHRWVCETYHISIGYHWLRVYMIKYFGSKLKVGRKSHYRKDEQEAASFLKTYHNDSKQSAKASKPINNIVV